MPFQSKVYSNFDLGSPDSGISSSDEMVFESESNDILRELFDVQINENTSKDLSSEQEENNKIIILPPMEKSKSLSLLNQPSSLEVSPKKVQLPAMGIQNKSNVSKNTNLKI